MTAQSAAFIPKQKYRHNAYANFQPVSYARVTSSGKAYQKNSETENRTDQSTECQKNFDHIKQIVEIKESYGANTSELSDLENLKRVLHG